MSPLCDLPRVAQVSRPLVEALHAYLSAEVVKLARGHDLAKAIQYMLKRWPAFTLFLDDGRICMSNNAAERSLRGVALGRKSWLFCGSDRGGPARRGHVQPHRHRQDERRRSAGVARRRSRPHRRASRSPARGVVALELESASSGHVGKGCLTTPAQTFP
jgi:hypothetical protein